MRISNFKTWMVYEYFQFVFNLIYPNQIYSWNILKVTSKYFANIVAFDLSRFIAAL